MPTTLTSKGQVTIPKRIRDALHLLPGTAVEFAVNAGGEVVLHAAVAAEGRAPRTPRSFRRRAWQGRCQVEHRRVDEAASWRRLMLLVDTNVLVDILQDDPQWAQWSIGQLRAQAKVHELAINPVIYAEMSLSFSTIEALDVVVSRKMELTLSEIPEPALFLAGKAFAQYRRRGGGKMQVLPDFFIGAHAAVRGWPLLTRDAGRFRSSLSEPGSARAVRRHGATCPRASRLTSSESEWRGRRRWR